MARVRPALAPACVGVVLLAACGTTDPGPATDISAPKGFDQVAAQTRDLPWPSVDECPDLRGWGSITPSGSAGGSNGGHLMCDYQFSNDSPLFGGLASRYDIPAGHDETVNAEVSVVRLAKSLAETRAGVAASLANNPDTGGPDLRARLIDPSGLPTGSYYFAAFSHYSSSGSSYSCGLGVPMQSGALSIVATTRVPRSLAGADEADWCLVSRVVAFELD